MNAATGSSRGQGRTGGAFCRGTALCTASRPSRRCTPNFRATPWIVPRPNSYSRRICSNSSTVAFLRRISPLPTVHFAPRAYAAAAQGGPFPTIKLGQTRVSKTTLAGIGSPPTARRCLPPLGGAATGPDPTNRGKLGTKRHVLSDRRGAPLGVVLSAANQTDMQVAAATLDSVVVPRPAPTAGHPQ